MKKILILLLLGILLLGNVSALDSLGAGKQGKNFTIIQSCDGATYITIGGILYPDKTVKAINENMTLIGSGTFTYNFTDTTQLGTYSFSKISDCPLPSIDYSFEITPSGNSGSENIWFNIFLIIFIYGLVLLGFFKENSIITIMGGMFMLFLGVYFINNGIIIYRDDMTRYFSYVTLGLGAFFSLIGGNWLYNDL